MNRVILVLVMLRLNLGLLSRLVWRPVLLLRRLLSWRLRMLRVGVLVGITFGRTLMIRRRSFIWSRVYVLILWRVLVVVPVF